MREENVIHDIYEVQYNCHNCDFKGAEMFKRGSACRGKSIECRKCGCVGTLNSFGWIN